MTRFYDAARAPQDDLREDLVNPGPASMGTTLKCPQADSNCRPCLRRAVRICAQATNGHNLGLFTEFLAHLDAPEILVNQTEYCHSVATEARAPWTRQVFALDRHMSAEITCKLAPKPRAASDHWLPPSLGF